MRLLRQRCASARRANRGPTTSSIQGAFQPARDVRFERKQIVRYELLEFRRSTQTVAAGKPPYNVVCSVHDATIVYRSAGGIVIASVCVLVLGCLDRSSVASLRFPAPVKQCRSWVGHSRSRNDRIESNQIRSVFRVAGRTLWFEGSPSALGRDPPAAILPVPNA